MSRKNKAYQKLPGIVFNLFYAPSLWQGADHLLSVDAVLFQERYKRFYYKDIQAIVMRRTNRHHVWSSIWGGIALLFALIAIISSGPNYVSSGFLVLFLLLLCANLLLGSACKVQLQTAVQIQELRSLRRKRSATKAMDRIIALVENAQGRLDMDALPSKSAKSNPASLLMPGATGLKPASGIQSADTMTKFNPLWHRLIFSLFLVMGGTSLVQFGLKSLTIGVLEALLQSAAQVLVIVAVARGYRYLKGTWLAKISWVSLGMVFIISLVGYSLLFIVSARHPDKAYNNWELFKVGFELISNKTPVMLTMNITFTLGYLLLGLLGLLAMHRLHKGPANQSGSKP